MPLVSVVIPAYNRSNVIGRALKSVLDQSLQNFEIIVVDDGSSDDLATALAEYDDDRIRLIRQSNGGANRARNTGIDAALGQFVAFLDSDDLFLPHHLESAVAYLLENAATAVFSPVIVDRGDGRTFIKPPYAPNRGEPISEYLLSRRGFIQTSTVALATETARKVRYREGLRFGQDKDFAIRLAQSGCKIKMLDKAGAVWTDVRDPKRISAAYRSEARLSWLEEIRPSLTSKAFHADRGWVVAKALFAEKKRLKATAFYINALLRGCYSPALAATVLLQIVLSGASYRSLADKYVGLKKPAKLGKNTS